MYSFERIGLHFKAISRRLSGAKSKAISRRLSGAKSREINAEMQLRTPKMHFAEFRNRL